MSRYVSLIACLALVFVMALACFNCLVNPYQLFQHSLFELKHRPVFHSMYLVKPYLQRRQPPELLIAGSSRAGSSLNPEHPALSRKFVFNAGLPAAGLEDVRRSIELAARQGQLQEVVLALDYYMFAGADLGVDTAARLDLHHRLSLDSSEFEYWLVLATDYVRVLLSWPATVDSLRTLQEQETLTLSQDTSLSLQSNGLWQLSAQASRNSAKAFLGKLREATYLYCGLAPDPSHLPSIDYAPYRQLLKDLHHRRLHAKLVILPMHGALREVIAACGLEEHRRAWLRSMVELNTDSAERVGRESYPIWDFSGFSETVAVPPPSGEPMRWFQDASHPTLEMGNRVLDAIYSQHSSANFGTMLNELVFDQHLADDQRGASDYRLKHPLPQLPRWVDRLRKE